VFYNNALRASYSHEPDKLLLALIKTRALE